MKKLTFLISVSILFCIVQSGFSAQSDIDIVKKRVIATAMKPSVNDTEIEKLLNTIREDGTWPGIDYEDVRREGFEHTRHLSNMVELGRAYKTKSSKFYKSKKVKNAVEMALKNWVDHDYICDNWWNNQIGTPGALVTLMIIIGDDLPDDLVQKAQPMIGRANINAPGARPGGDRIKIAGIEAKNMLFLGNTEKFDEIIRVIEGEIKFSEWVGAIYGYGYRSIPTGFSNRQMGGRGIQYDHSFHHRVDGVNNTLSYGTGYADAFIEWAVYTAGTKYSFSEEKLDKLIDYYLDGICKMLVFGKYPDMGAKNRSISRTGALRAYQAETVKNLMLTTDYRKNELQAIADIRENGTKPTLSHATFFWDTEHFSFQRPDWFASVRMYSTRNYNMEVGYNSEGLKNHYRGDGANHVYTSGDEYNDIAPVFDYRKVPGATIVQKADMPDPDEIQKLGETDFVGAATDGLYAAVAFDFKSPHDPLIGRKSWFFFDDEYVCLGAGISCKTNLPVATTVNQCLLRDDVTVSVNHSEKVLEKGEREMENVDWVFQDGIGYVFPESMKVNIKNNAASGSWWDINKQTDSPKGTVQKDVFKLWINHGERPSDATYEYIVVPAATNEKLAQNESKNNIVILKNTPELQAVQNKKLNITEVVFYKAGEIQIAPNLKLISNNPGIVLVKTDGGKITEISVMDPNRELMKYDLSISTRVENSSDDFTSVWNNKDNLSDISILLPQGNYAGKSKTIEL